MPEIDAPGKKDVEECYGLIREAMRQLGCRLIYRKEIAYGPPIREVRDESYLQHPE